MKKESFWNRFKRVFQGNTIKQDTAKQKFMRLRNLSSEEQLDAHVEKVIRGSKKVPYNQEGNYDTRFNLTNMSESIWIPVREKG
jgi:hypothetical protein